MVGEDGEHVESVLSVGVNSESGYGALIWWCEDASVERVAAAAGVEVAEHVWVSVNPSPPDRDPKVTSDPWCPSYFDRISALPLTEIRAAVEEYFRTGDGLRPSGIEWAKGNFNGEFYSDGK
ncbi:Imm1 family immunity protein [Streptomyces polyrhachis]|uniref:Imm1 family immunity protein n=1 Tax=Streptomyces polyrhachis TaxID=1282885 RepID=A0ABW2GIE7_9ACTN